MRGECQGMPKLGENVSDAVWWQAGTTGFEDNHPPLLSDIAFAVLSTALGARSLRGFVAVSCVSIALVVVAGSLRLSALQVGMLFLLKGDSKGRSSTVPPEGLSIPRPP
jgi:hypothetical protein